MRSASRRLVTAACLISAALAATATAADAAEIVYGKPGDTGDIKFPVHVLPDSPGALPNARITMTASHDAVSLLPSSDDGPLTLSPGNNWFFRMDYAVANVGFEGVETVALKLAADTEDTNPLLGEFDRTVSIFVDSKGPYVSVSGDYLEDLGLDNVIEFDGTQLAGVSSLIIGSGVLVQAFDGGAGLKRLRISKSPVSSALDRVNFDKGDNFYALSLEEGEYEVYAEDNAGNVTSGVFKVDYGVSAEFLSITETERGFTAKSRSHWGVKTVRLVDLGPGGPNFDDFPDPSVIPAVQYYDVGGVASYEYSMSGIANGDYELLAVDEIGATTRLHLSSLLEVSTTTVSGQEVVVMSAFSVSPPFFTSDGIVRLDFGGFPYRVEMGLEGVTQPGSSAVLLRSGQQTLTAGHFSSPEGSVLWYEMTTTAVSSGTASVTVSFDPRGLSEAQVAGIQLLQYQSTGTVDATVAIDTSAHTVSAHLTTLDPFVVSIPAPSTTTYATETSTQVAGGPEIRVESYYSDLELRGSSPSETAAGLAALRAATSLAPIGRVYAIGSSAQYLRPRAAVAARFDPDALPEGFTAADAAVYVSTDGFHTARPLIHAGTSVSSGTAVGELAELSPSATTYIAVLGRRAPPVTSLVALGASFTAGGRVYASTATGLRLVPSEGETTTYLKLDGGAFQVVQSSFVLSEGTHTVVFYSQSPYGGIETPRTALVAMDGTPPVTEFSFSQAASTFGGVYSIPAEAALIFQSTDPVSGGVNAGLATIRYLVDVSSATCPNGLFAEPDSEFPPGSCRNSLWTGAPLSAGFHSVFFAAQDAVGNAETVRELSVFVRGTPHSGGLGIGRDEADQLWTVVSGDDSVALARVDAAGALLSSTTLPDGKPSYQWNVFFDEVGRTYAVGTASGATTVGTDLAVYRVTTAGDALVSSRAFDSGFANNDYAFDAAFPGWIAGAAENGAGFTLTLWRFDAAMQTITLATTAGRGGGLDAGTGVAVDGAGSVWVAGFSQGPSPDPARPVDLALWKFDSSGQLSAGPFVRPGYLADYQGTQLARVFVSSAAVFVTAPRARAVGYGSDLALVKFDAASGAVLAESFWRPADGSTAAPAAILAEGPGVLVAGAFDDGGTTAGLWHYSLEATTVAAASAEAGGAQGAVFRDGDLWLSVDGATVPYRVTAQTPVAGAFVDTRPPRTSLAAGTPSYPGDKLYATNATTFTLTAVDDLVSTGDGLGVGSTRTYVSTGGYSFSLQSGTFAYADEGVHPLFFYSVDLEGNAEAVSSRTIAVDLTMPAITLVSSGPLFALEAVDLSTHDAASGVAQINYLVDADPESCGGVEPSTSAPPGTCANLAYAGPFSLAAGTHTVLYQAIDRVGNGTDVIFSSSIVVASTAQFVMIPSTGPIGVPFTIAGAGFGAYAGANTRVRFGVSTAPISVWNDAQIQGTVPGLSTGVYAVAVERQTGSTTAVLAALAFEVTALSPTASSVSSGPIGIPFTFTGSGFGPYAGTNTRVLFGATTAPISVWNDSTISGAVPGVSPGTMSVVIERRTGDGFASQSEPLEFEITVPAIAAVSPSSAPIGAAYALTGVSFGPYAGTNTQVLIGGTTTPVAVWNNFNIAGTVPGSLAPGVYDLLVERRTADGGLVQSATVAFTVAGLGLGEIIPSTGPIGVPFTINGSGFGVYAGANTRVRFGVSTAAISVWNDAQITGTVPSLSTGAYDVVVERQQGVDVAASNATTFTITSPSIVSVTPSSGAIGGSFTLSGTSFGPYAGTNTQVLIGGTTTPIAVWNDATITGTVPGGLTPGVHPLIARRVGAGGVVSDSNEVSFEVTGMTIASINPSTGPIGVSFTISGSHFGAYAGANTRARFGVSTAAISVWNDTTVTGTIPPLSTGTVTVVLERQQGVDVAYSTVSSFTVTELAFSAAPSSGPIGISFTLSGAGFGAYAGANTRLLLGGATCAVAVWNDATITGTVPPVPAGAQPLWIERKSGTGVQSSATSYFLVVVPEVASLTPSSAPIGAPFTISGSNFGTYAGANTRVKFGGVTAPISVWNNFTITGTVPGAAAAGATEVVVERVSGGGLSQSATQAFLVLIPAISTIAPSYGPSGTVVTVSGFGFGPYAGANTKLLIGGSTVAVSVWNDTTIRWTVPAWLADGDYPVVVRRTPAGGTVDSASGTFTVGTSFGGSSFGFGGPQQLAAQPDQNFEGLMNLSAEEGGRIETPAKAAVELPPNAMDEDKEISLKRARGDGFRSQAVEEARVRAAGEPIEFGPEGTRFNAPVWIELPYDPALTPDESKVAIHYYDPLRRAWDALPSVVDRVRRVVRAQTSHFSIYQPMAIGVTTAAQDEFYLRDHFAYPNPARGGLVTFRVQPGLADTVEVRVYDIAGRKVYSSSDFAHTAPGGEHQYENIWNVSGVGSGVYTYAIRASRAGQKTISKTGKVGVIK